MGVVSEGLEEKADTVWSMTLIDEGCPGLTYYIAAAFDILLDWDWIDWELQAAGSLSYPAGTK